MNLAYRPRFQERDGSTPVEEITHDVPGDLGDELRLDLAPRRRITIAPTVTDDGALVVSCCPNHRLELQPAVSLDSPVG